MQMPEWIPFGIAIENLEAGSELEYNPKTKEVRNASVRRVEESIGKVHRGDHRYREQDQDGLQRARYQGRCPGEQEEVRTTSEGEKEKTKERP